SATLTFSDVVAHLLCLLILLSPLSPPRSPLFPYTTLFRSGSVVFHGHVDEATNHRILAGADIHLLPSRKEGWGLAVSEAGQHAVPTVGYHHAAGLRDSIDDGETGLLVDGVDAMADATRGLLA